MTLAPGRYVFTLRVTHNLLGRGVPAGTRIVANVIMRATGRHEYKIREIAPNPAGYALEMGDFAEPDWLDGIAIVVRELLGQKVEIMVEAKDNGVMVVYVSHADTELRMFSAEGKWRRDKNQANLEPTVPDIQSQVPTIRWQDRLTRQMLFMGAPQYQWAQMSNAQMNAALDAIAAAGIDGPSIEFGGVFIRDEYNKVPNGGDIADIYDRQIEAWKPWDAAIRARGQVAHLAFLNANQSKANRMSDGLWEAKARAFIRTYGPENKLVLPLSETDTRTRTSIGNSIAKGLLAGGLPKSQIISMAGKWGDFNETHHGRGKVPSGGHRTINVNDNGPSIADLYGPKWQQGGTPNLPHIQEYSEEIRRKGVSGAIYSFGTEFDFAGCAVAGKAFGNGSSTIPPTDPTGSADSIPVESIREIGKHRADSAKAKITVRLHSASLGRGGVTLSFDDFDWPKPKKKKGEKITDGGVCIVWEDAGEYVGGWFDHHGHGQTFKTTKNISGGYVDGRQPAKGAKTWVYLISYDGAQRSNIVYAGEWK